MLKSIIVEIIEAASHEVCYVSHEEIFDLIEIFQDQMETMQSTLKQILARISALKQAPQSRSTRVGFDSKCGGDKVYFVLDYSTSTSSRSNHDSDDKLEYQMKIYLPQFNGRLKIEELLD